jgi:hypothetical protein
LGHQEEEAIARHYPGVSSRGAARRIFHPANNVKAVIPGKSNRKKWICHDKQAYKVCNVVECYWL